MVVHAEFTALELVELLTTLQESINTLEYIRNYMSKPEQKEQYTATILRKKILHEKLQNFLTDYTLCPLKSNAKDGANEDEKISR